MPQEWLKLSIVTYRLDFLCSCAAYLLLLVPRNEVASCLTFVCSVLMADKLESVWWSCWSLKLMMKSVCGMDLVPLGWSGKQAVCSWIESLRGVQAYWLHSTVVCLTCSELALGSQCLCCLQVSYSTQVRVVVNFSLSFILCISQNWEFWESFGLSCGQGVF